MSDGESKPRRAWAHRSAPYAWERVLLWALITVCVGPEAAAGMRAFLGLVLP